MAQNAVPLFSVLALSSFSVLRAQLSDVRVTPLETISEGDMVCMRHLFFVTGRKRLLEDHGRRAFVNESVHARSFISFLRGTATAQRIRNGLAKATDFPYDPACLFIGHCRDVGGSSRLTDFD